MGLVTFYVACSLGALINVALAHQLFRAIFLWYLAGICGMAISSVWNYGVYTVVTWRREQIGWQADGDLPLFVGRLLPEEQLFKRKRSS